MQGALASFSGRILVVLSGADLMPRNSPTSPSNPIWQRLLGAERFSPQIDKADSHLFTLPLAGSGIELNIRPVAFLVRFLIQLPCCRVTWSARD